MSPRRLTLTPYYYNKATRYLVLMVNTIEVPPS